MSLLDEMRTFFKSALLPLRKDVCILWKPAGWTVSVGNFEEENEVEVQWRAGAKGKPLQDWLRENLGRSWPIASDQNADFGLVHRLDRDTSGPILCAKTYQGFHRLHLCLVSFKARKEYLCLCEGFVKGPRLLDMKLRVEGSGASRRSLIGARGHRAILKILETAHLRGPDSAAVSLVRIRLHTGRMHQIRAQLASLGHPLVGDAHYGQRSDWLPRIFLHASSLSVRLPNELLQADCALPDDLREGLRLCAALDVASRILCQRQLQ